MNAGRPQLRFHEAERAFTVDFTEHIDDHIRKVNEALTAGLEAATLTLIIEHLRSQGYVVTEPPSEPRSQPFRVGDTIRLAGPGWANVHGANYVDARAVVFDVDADGRARFMLASGVWAASPHPGHPYYASIKLRSDGSRP